MGLDLMAEDTPHVNFADYSYSIGVGAYGEISVPVCPEGVDPNDDINEQCYY